MSLGADSTADGDNATAVGTGASAGGASATAIGQQASASFVNSTAIGANAATSRDNQFAFGTAGNTYTMAGVTSAASRAAQSGPLEVVTTDSAGNLASDQGFIFNTLDHLDDRIDKQGRKLSEGVAMAMAVQDPDLMGNEIFGLKLNWGTYQQSNAVGMSAAGVLAHNLLAEGDRLSISGGIGYGVQEKQLGGRVGLQFSW